MNITFILPVVSQPRYWKRIKSLEKLGCVARVLAFEREYIPMNDNNKDYIIIGKLESKKYYKRMIHLIRVLSQVRNNIKHADIIYVFGLDLLFLAHSARFFIGKKIEIVYEVGDIRTILIGNSVHSIFFRWIEKCLFKYIGLLVVTSEAYVTEYFNKIQRIKNIKYQVIENKIVKEDFNKLVFKERPKKSNILTIGYFGLLNCERALEILKKVAIQGGRKVEVHIRGIIMKPKNLTVEIGNVSNIKYYGSYIAPDDLPQIYGMIDLVWACYPFSKKKMGNWLWARTNRFYEACFFKKPIIAQDGSIDCHFVKKLQIGLCLDLNHIQQSVDKLLNINNDQLLLWASKIKNISEDVYIYKDEHILLYEKLEGLTKVQ